MIRNEIIKEYERLYDPFGEKEVAETEYYGFPKGIKIFQNALIVEESEKHYGALFPKEQMFTVNIINATTINYFVTNVLIDENFNDTEIKILEVTNTEIKSESITPLSVILDFTELQESYYSFSFLIKTNVGLPLKQKVHFAIHESGKINYDNKIKKTKTLDLKIKRKHNVYFCKNENLEIFIPEQGNENIVYINSNTADYVKIINKTGCSKIMEMPTLNRFFSTFDSSDKYFMFQDNKGNFINQFNNNIFLIDNNYNVFQQGKEKGQDKLFRITMKDHLKVKLLFPKFVEIIDTKTINERMNYYLMFNYSAFYESKNLSHVIIVVDAKGAQVLEIPVKFSILYNSLTIEKIFAEININQEQIFLQKVEANIKFQTIGIGKAQIEIPNEYISHKAQIMSTKQTNLINYKLEIDTQIFKNNKERKIVIPIYFINEAQQIRSYQIILNRIGVYFENTAGSILGEYFLYYPYRKRITDTIVFEDECIEIVDFEYKKIEINGGNQIILSKQENVLTVIDERTKIKISEVKQISKNKFEYYIYSAFQKKSARYDYTIGVEFLTNTNNKVLLFLRFMFGMFYCEREYVKISYPKKKTQDSIVANIQNISNSEPLCIYGIEDMDNVKININKSNFKEYPILIKPSSHLQISCLKSDVVNRGVFNLRINNIDKIKVEI